MKRTISATELRALDQATLARRLTELEINLNRTRLEALFGKVANHQAVKALRRQLAQGRTIQTEQGVAALLRPETNHRASVSVTKERV